MIPLRIPFAAIVLLAALPGWGATCSVSPQSTAFGAYDPFASSPLDGTGNVAVTCDVSVPYTLALSTGAGTYSSRVMLNGTHRLTYNLFRDASRTTIWGDGSASTALVNGSGISANYPVYGRIAPRQNAYIGSYSDLIVVTVTY